MTWEVSACEGSPEVVFGYAILLVAIWVVGYHDCPTDEGGIAQCPDYAYSSQTQVGFTQATSWDDLPDPSVDGVDIYNVVAVNESGGALGECYP